VLSDRMRGRLAQPFKRPYQAGCVRQATGQPVRVEALAHAFAEVLASFLPAALDDSGEDRDGAFSCARQHGPGHRRTGAGIDRPPESLEGGLAGGAERITDLLPAMAACSRLVDGYLQGSVGRPRQLSCGTDRCERADIWPGQLRCELSRCAKQGNSRRIS
jgi:hypothetical protein